MQDVNIIQTKLVRVGNSKGIVIPKKMLNLFNDTVRLRQNENSIVIEPVQEKVVPQEKWEEIFSKYKHEYDYEEFKDWDVALNDGSDD